MISSPARLQFCAAIVSFFSPFTTLVLSIRLQSPGGFRLLVRSFIPYFLFYFLLAAFACTLFCFDSLHSAYMPRPVSTDMTR